MCLRFPQGASEDNNTAEYVAAAGRSLTAGLLQALNTRPPRFEEVGDSADIAHLLSRSQSEMMFQ